MAVYTTPSGSTFRFICPDCNEQDETCFVENLKKNNKKLNGDKKLKCLTCGKKFLLLDGNTAWHATAPSSVKIKPLTPRVFKKAAKAMDDAAVPVPVNPLVAWLKAQDTTHELMNRVLSAFEDRHEFYEHWDLEPYVKEVFPRIHREYTRGA